jgi:ubiquinone/menaquinone biosynthesis C-methylase UbiE
LSTEELVTRHYAGEGVERSILEALEARGKDIENLTTADLASADQMHLGWRPATVEFAKALDLSAGDQVLDIGCGLGGSTRYFAETYGCRVPGVDLTEELVKVARSLTRRCGLADRVTFKLGSALALPFHDSMFDVATIVHVGMNIADKAKLFAEARRVLKPKGRLGVYDAMRVADGELPFPMPWALTPETSFVETLATYRGLLEAAGFRIESERDRRDFVMTVAAEARARAAGREAGVSVTLAARPERLVNAQKALEAGTITPVEFTARAV